MGHTPLTSQALSAPPFLLSFLTVLLTAHLSDRSRSRSPFILMHSLLAATSYILLSLGGRMIEVPINQVPASAAFPHPTPPTPPGPSLIGTTAIPLDGTLLPVGMRAWDDGRIDAVPLPSASTDTPPGDPNALAIFRGATTTQNPTSAPSQIQNHEAVGANAPWSHSRATAPPHPDALPLDPDTGTPQFRTFQHIDPKVPHPQKGGESQPFDPATGRPITVLTTRFSSRVRYLLIFPACAGFFSCITLIITWTLNNQRSGTGKGAGMMLLNLVGQCGPLLGVRLFPDGEGPGFSRGMGVCGLAMVLVAVLAWGLRWYLGRENRRVAVVGSFGGVSRVGGSDKKGKGKGKGVYEPVAGHDTPEGMEDEDDDGLAEVYHDATGGDDISPTPAAPPAPARDTRFVYML